MDVALYPLDTLKTRIQSEQGLWKAGGFRQIYKGIGPIAVGSAPCGKLTLPSSSSRFSIPILLDT